MDFIEIYVKEYINKENIYNLFPKSYAKKIEKFLQKDEWKIDNNFLNQIISFDGQTLSLIDIKQNMNLHQQFIKENFNDNEMLLEKEKDAIVKIRICQKEFRNKLLQMHNHKCQITNIENDNLLIASHIKPFSISNKYESQDASNGLLLCSLIDSLFDKGLITFDNKTGEIVYKNF